MLFDLFVYHDCGLSDESDKKRARVPAGRVKTLKSRSKKQKCWEVFHCNQATCPAFMSKEGLRCWLVAGTHCRDEIQGKFLEKMEMCLCCSIFRGNMDTASMEKTMKVVAQQFSEFRSTIEARDTELERMSIELAIGMSEVFEALRKISSGDPDVRIPEDSTIELIRKLKHEVNLTAKEIGEIVNQSHDIAIVLAEHFDVLHRVSQGILSARVYGESNIELLESLKNVTNEMIENTAREIHERRRAEADLQKARDELEVRVNKRTAELTIANERLQQEIAERNRIEEALRKSEQKYRTVFENTGNPTLLIEVDNTISMINTEFEQHSGYSREEIEGKKQWIDFFRGDDLDKLKEYHYARRIDPNAAPSHYEAHFVDKRGNVRDVLLSISMIPGSRKSVVSILDVTEKKKLEERVSQSDKLSSIGTLAAGVAHEINNPLAIILGFTDLLLEKVPPGSDFQDMLETIQKQGNNAKRIVENLLSFVRFKEHREEAVDINKNLGLVLALESNTFLLNNISVHTDLSEHLPQVRGDPGELQQVFVNIINNAVAAMQGGGVLSISTKVSDNGQNIEIKISDTGSGIEREHRKKIFDPLFTTKKVGEGTGLGLTVSYAMIKKQGGWITFETKTKEESEQTGTTFIITLPAMQSEKRTISAAEKRTDLTTTD